MNKLHVFIYMFLVLLCVAVIVTSITAFIMYSGKPITEIPAWALIFMFGGRK